MKYITKSFLFSKSSQSQLMVIFLSLGAIWQFVYSTSLCQWFTSKAMKEQKCNALKISQGRRRIILWFKRRTEKHAYKLSLKLSLKSVNNFHHFCQELLTIQTVCTQTTWDIALKLVRRLELLQPWAIILLLVVLLEYGILLYGVCYFFSVYSCLRLLEKFCGISLHFKRRIVW